MNSVSAKEVFHEPILGRVTFENRNSKNKTTTKPLLLRIKSSSSTLAY